MQTRQDDGQFQVREQLLTTLSYVTPSSSVVSAQRIQDMSGVYNPQAVVAHLEAKLQSLISDNQHLLAMSADLFAQNQSQAARIQSLEFELHTSHLAMSAVQNVAVRTFIEKDLIIQNLHANLSLFRPVVASVVRSTEALLVESTASNSTDSSASSSTDSTTAHRPPSPLQL